jgi:6-phosphogluconate dehydrogenase
MKIGMIGLGRMGMNMVRRLVQGGQEVVAFNRTPEKTREIMAEGAEGSFSLAELVEKLPKPRVVWLMLPAGRVVEDHIVALKQLLDEGDIIIEGGNSNYKDDIRRAEMLKTHGLRYVDAGVSGGVWGLKVGFCTMVGGERADFDFLEPVFQTLAPEGGYLYCGSSGAGHYVKMIHNGIEYGMMQAYGEGFAILDASPYGAHLENKEVAKLWNQGSVIRSWLLELLESAFEEDQNLGRITGYVEDSGEGRWCVDEAVVRGVAAPVIAHSLFQRFQSRDENSFSNRVLAALRQQFGGHAVKKSD